MAERIRRQAGGEFAGAILIVPPSRSNQSEPPIEILVVSPHPDLEHFWAAAEAQVAAGKAEWLQRVQGQNPMYGVGRR
jgi:hypothetical protein